MLTLPSGLILLLIGVLPAINFIKAGISCNLGDAVRARIIAVSTGVIYACGFHVPQSLLHSHQDIVFWRRVELMANYMK